MRSVQRSTNIITNILWVKNEGKSVCRASASTIAHFLWVRNGHRWGQSAFKGQSKEITHTLSKKWTEKKVSLHENDRKEKYTLPLSCKWTEMRSVCLQSSPNTITHSLQVKKKQRWARLLAKISQPSYSHTVDQKCTSVSLQISGTELRTRCESEMNKAVHL